MWLQFMKGRVPEDGRSRGNDSDVEKRKEKVYRCRSADISGAAARWADLAPAVAGGGDGLERLLIPQHSAIGHLVREADSYSLTKDSAVEFVTVIAK